MMKQVLFGRMIREARIHFAAVIEECRIAGLDTSDIAALLGQATDVLADSIRPELREPLEQLVARPVGVAGGGSNANPGVTPRGSGSDPFRFVACLAGSRSGRRPGSSRYRSSTAVASPHR